VKKKRYCLPVTSVSFVVLSVEFSASLNANLAESSTGMWVFICLRLRLRSNTATAATSTTMLNIGNPTTVSAKVILFCSGLVDSGIEIAKEEEGAAEVDEEVTEEDEGALLVVEHILASHFLDFKGAHSRG